VTAKGPGVSCTVVHLPWFGDVGMQAVSSISETHRVRALPAQHHYRYSVAPVVPVALLHIDTTRRRRLARSVSSNTGRWLARLLLVRSLAGLLLPQPPRQVPTISLEIYFSFFEESLLNRSEIVTYSLAFCGFLHHLNLQ
jgi:hypothetical protein